MKSKIFARSRGRFVMFYKRHSFEVYYPYIQWELDSYGLFAKTLFVFKPRCASNQWRWDRAFAVAILGLGFGWAYNHADNPNYVYQPLTGAH